MIGIDLGTTFSAAAYLDPDGNPQLVSNSRGTRLTPSVVMEEDDGTVVVGEDARESMVLMGDAVVSTVKDYMGTDRKFVLPSGTAYTPEQVSALILKKIVKDAEEFLGEEIRQAVVTVPAYFNDAQRQATKDAGRMAGLDVACMPNEPTAAALYYAWSSRMEKGRILVYDLGGGTFDASIVEICGKQAEVVATGGIRKLGGHFFDQLILNYAADYLLEKYGLDVYDDEYVDELQELSLKAENCKIQLSSRTSAQMVIKIGKVREKLEITRAQFEKMIAGFYGRTESTVRMVFQDAGMSWKDIDKLLLVGGSSKIPYIAERLREFSGMEPSHETNPDEAVALGAALYASGLFEKVQDVCSHSLGIVSRRGAGAEKYNSVIIPRNTALPARMSRDYYTGTNDMKKICLEITEGEDEDLDYVSILAGIEILLPPGIPRNTRVTVEMFLNQNQLLHVYARIHAEPEIYKEIEIPRSSNLDESEIAEQTTLLERIVVQ